MQFTKKKQTCKIIHGSYEQKSRHRVHTCSFEKKNRHVYKFMDLKKKINLVIDSIYEANKKVADLRVHSRIV